MNDDKPTHRERLKDLKEKSAGSTQKKQSDGDEGEASCLAFGYLRGIRDHASAVEFRFRDGNSTWFPYNWLGPSSTIRPKGCS
jgi:hypothetical protein